MAAKPILASPATDVLSSAFARHPFVLRLGVWAVVALAALLSFPRKAKADGSYDGTWTLTPVTESYTVQQWSSACGPPPVSGTAIVGGPVAVNASGDELVIAAARTLRTDTCLDPLPTLAASVHTRDQNSWRTRCSTPQADPRHAVINTAYFVVGNDTLNVAETGRYEFTINGARCIADVKRSGSLFRVVAAPAGASSATSTESTATAPTAAATALPAPSASPAPKVDCSFPGAGATLQVRPARKLLRAGQAFAFRGVVLDASGCVTATPIAWAIDHVAFKDGQPHAARPAIDPNGRLIVPAQDFGDATFDVVATAAGRSARAAVQVAIPADYDGLLAQSGLDENGEIDAPSVAVLATSAIGASATKAQDTARRRRVVFIGIVSGLIVLVGAVALVGARRARDARRAQAAAVLRHAEKMVVFQRQKEEREAMHAAQMKAHLESVAIAQQQAAAAVARGIDTGPVYCPSCRREYPAGTAFCAFDSNRLLAIRGHESLMTGPAGGVCPVCGKGYNPGVKVCADHGEELVPAAVANLSAQEPAALTQRGKICPTCGDRFDGSSGFCGKDGTQLVLVN